MPVKNALTKADTTYSVAADLTSFAADKLVMNQKLESNALKIVANNAGYQVRGDVKINGQRPRSTTASPSRAMPTSSSRQRSMKEAAHGWGSISAPQVRQSADQAGWQDRRNQPHGHRGGSDRAEARQCPAGLGQRCRAGRVRVFNVVQKPQSTRFEDIVVDGGGVSIRDRSGRSERRLSTPISRSIRPPMATRAR